jgi:hypothetical protein
MYIVGFILTAGGIAPAVFGQFSYNFINPDHIPPIEGYYTE